MKAILIVRETMLKVCLLIVLTASLTNGLTQGLTEQDTTYTFTGEQVKEMLKVAFELEECNKTVFKLSDLADTSQKRINILDNFIHEKNLLIAKEQKRKRWWRGSTIGVVITGVLLILVK